MTNIADIIKQRLNDAFNPTQLELIDDSHKHIGHAGNTTGGGHFTLRIDGEAFDGMTLIEKHRAIYQVLGDLIPTQVHALSIR